MSSFSTSNSPIILLGKSFKSLEKIGVACSRACLASKSAMPFASLKVDSSMEAPSMRDRDCCKRLRIFSSLDEANERLIPSLPNEISLIVLARLPRSCYLNLKLVCRSWKAAILSNELYNVRKEIGNMNKWLYIFTENRDGKLTCNALDPMSRQWHRIPEMPCVVVGEQESMVLSAEKTKGYPVRGYGVGAVKGCIYVLGGICNEKTLKCVWRYDPILNSWGEVCPMSVGRAYCHTSVLGGKLYVVGGLSKSGGKFTALHSGEVFDPSTGLWVPIPSMPFSGIKRLFPFHDQLKELNPSRYQATGLAAYGRKLYAPQSMLHIWFHSNNPDMRSAVDIGVDVYDPKTNSWIEMKDGKGCDWPKKRAGARSTMVLNGHLHGISLTSNCDRGRIKVYDRKANRWRSVKGSLDVKNFVKSVSPCLLSACMGRLHVVTKDENDKIIVMQAKKRKLRSIPHDTPATISNSYLAWEVIASKVADSMDLVSCQILKI